MAIMPTTVPNKPNSGAIDPIDPSNVRFFVKRLATTAPAASICCMAPSRLVRSLRKPAASTLPSGELASSLATTSGVIFRFLQRPSTSVNKVAGTTFLRCNAIPRSIISPSAKMDARIRGIMGQPSSMMMANNGNPLWCGRLRERAL